MKTSHAAKYAVFREIMKEAREDQGLKQKEVASRLNLPQSFVSKYENGERRLDVVEFLAVSAALGVDPIKILKNLNEKLGRLKGLGE